MKKRSYFYAMTMGLVLGFALTAGAATFISDDGVVSIEAPDPEDEDTAVWKQTVDPNHWFTISDGKSTITIDHLSNGENLPQLQIADDDCETVFQTFASTTNEVFVLKAASPEEENLDDLMQISGTMKILKYGTKTALRNTGTTEKSEYGIREISGTYYVTADELNVRSYYSTDSEIFGVVRRGEEVKVTGAVQRNGVDYGWYRISWEGRDAYVSAGFVSGKKPTKETKKTETGIYPISNGFTAYDRNGNNQGILVKYSDGYYYSNDMMPYRDNGDGSYYGVSTGDTLYNYNPNGSVDNMSGSQPESFQVWDSNGHIQGYLTPHTDDGYYYSNDNMPYRDNGDGSYYGINTGDTLYSYDPSYMMSSGTQTGTAGSNYYGDVVTHLLSENTTGAQVYVSATDPDSYVWTDADGTEYQNNGDGTFTDYYGNRFTLVY